MHLVKFCLMVLLVSVIHLLEDLFFLIGGSDDDDDDVLLNVVHSIVC